MNLGHPSLVAQHHINPAPVEVGIAQRIENRARTGTAGHHEQHAILLIERRFQFPGQNVGQVDGQHFLVGIFKQFHALISLQRRPSRCISISASSGPALPDA